jgi:glycosyltransferase involved in cell wall biosynthesis
MRILLVTHRYPPDGVGGIERYVESTAAELVAGGDDVTVLTRRPTHWPRTPRLRDDEAAGPRVLRIDGSGVRLADPLAQYQALERLFQHVLDNVRPDVVHVNQQIGLSPRSIPLAKAADIPVVITLQDYYFGCPLVHLTKRNGVPCAGPDGGRECARTCFAGEPNTERRWTLRADYFAELLRLADRVVCPTEQVAGFFADFARGVEPLILPVGIGVGPVEREPRAAGGPLRLLVLGTLVPHKGARVLLAALAEARLLAVELTLAGRADDSRYVDELVGIAAGIPGLTLRTTGTYEPHELPQLLATADAVVFPSVAFEVYPFAPREALAAGVPLIAGRTGGLDEVIVEGQSGLLFAPGDAAGLAAALRRVDAEEGLLELLGRGAAETPVVTVAEHVGELRRIYAGAVAEPTHPPSDDERRLFEELRQVGFPARRFRRLAVAAPAGG